MSGGSPSPRHLALVLVTMVALLPAGSAIATTWLQYGGDAGNTGTSDTPGPATPDVAWHVDLGGQRPTYMAPLILDRVVYAPLLVLNGTAGQVWRVPLDDPVPALVAELGSPPTTWASDAAHLFIATEAGIQALSADDGTELWSGDHPQVAADQERVHCPFSKLAEGALFLACMAQGSSVGNPVYGEQGEIESILFVRALDQATGEERWRWSHQPLAQPGLAADPPEETSPTGAPLVVYLNGFALAGGTAVVAGIDGLSTGGIAQVAAWGLDRASGQLLWRTSSSVTEERRQDGPLLAFNAAEPAGSEEVVYVKLTDLIALNPARGTELWRTSLGDQDGGADAVGSGLALEPDALFAASRQTIYRFDTFDHRNGWRVTLAPSSDEVWGSTHLLLADDRLYARSVGLSNVSAGSTIHALDATDGTSLWTRFVPHEGPVLADLTHMMAIGEGTLLLAGANGSLWALGTTGASLVPHPQTDTLYPAPGQPVTLDLGQTTPGALGPATAYRIDWGDGNKTAWGPDELHEHTYARPGDHTVRVIVRNDAGQVASSTLQLHVGGRPHQAPTFLENAFARENQDLTFGVLGLATAAAGGLLALVRTRRRRSRLQRELDTLEAGYVRSQHDPAQCEAVLEEHRAAIHGLMVDGRLEDTQVAVLERRIDELVRELRLKTLDERLHFLPHGMVLSLRAILADGRINTWEREHLFRAVQGERSLSPEQRVIAMEVIDTWQGRDAGRPRGSP